MYDIDLLFDQSFEGLNSQIIKLLDFPLLLQVVVIVIAVLRFIIVANGILMVVNNLIRVVNGLAGTAIMMEGGWPVHEKSIIQIIVSTPPDCFFIAG